MKRTLAKIILALLILAMLGWYTQDRYDLFSVDDPEKVELFRAVRKGDATALKRALDAGVNPNSHLKYYGRKGYLLTAAVRSGHEDLVKMLIHAGADVNARKYDEDGPLVLAVFLGRCKIAAMLLAAGADPNQRFIHAAETAVSTEKYQDKTARELYQLDQLEKREAPISPSEKDKACWLEVGRLMK
jgi:ankyrin repeat protein